MSVNGLSATHAGMDLIWDYQYHNLVPGSRGLSILLLIYYCHPLCGASAGLNMPFIDCFYYSLFTNNSYYYYLLCTHKRLVTLNAAGRKVHTTLCTHVTLTHWTRQRNCGLYTGGYYHTWSYTYYCSSQLIYTRCCCARRQPADCA